MNSPNFFNKSILEPQLPTQNLNLKDDDDDIALLLDSIPELDSKFSITRRIGQGTFSSVYLGCSKFGLSLSGRNHFAIKQIIPTSHPSRIYMELKCLKLMGGKANIIEASLCLRNVNHIALIMPFFPHDNFVDYVGTLTTEEICDYLLNLFIALKKVHSFNIIHRDIKPANFLYCRKYRKYSMIDFGLAQEVKGRSYCSHISKSSTSSTKAAQRQFSPSFTETPRLNLTRQVKRKLPTLNTSSPESFQSNAKRLCVGSPIIPFGSTRLESNVAAVRRSPRKFPSSFKGSHSKENSPLKAKVKGPKTEESLNDSPSKHTRLALSFREGRFSFGQNENENSVLTNFTKKKTPADSFTPVRKSPRKPFNPIEWKVKVSRGLHDSFENLPASGRKTGFDLPIQTVSKEGPSFAASLSGYSVSGTLYSESRGSSRRSSVLQEVKTKSGERVLRPSSCSCYGYHKVCPVCLGRRNQHAPRAGTPGFRAPEVLIRHPCQTTAVDMWSVGVILVSLLSSRYPFFRAVDDLSSLAEIITILGTKVVKKAGSKLGKLLTSNETVPSLDLRLICDRLRNQSTKKQKDGMIKDDQEKCTGCKQTSNKCICLVVSLPRYLPGSLLACSKTPTQILSSLGSNLSADGTDSVDETTRNSYPVSLYNLLYRLLDPSPDSRITAEEAISHPFIVQHKTKRENC